MDLQGLFDAIFGALRHKKKPAFFEADS